MTKRCPFCAEEIQAAAIKCKHCGTLLDGSIPIPKAAPPPPPHSSARIAQQQEQDSQRRRRRTILLAASGCVLLGLAGVGFIVYRQRSEHEALDRAMAAAASHHCADADAAAARLYDPADRARAAQARLDCDVAALDQSFSSGACDGAEARADALATKYSVPSEKVVSQVTLSLGACLQQNAMALARQARCDDARAAVEHARTLLAGHAPPTLDDVAPACEAAIDAKQATVRVAQVKAIAETLAHQPGPALGAKLLASPADFLGLYDQLHVDAKKIAAIADPAKAQAELQMESERRDAAAKLVYLALVDKAYERYDAPTQTLVLDAMPGLAGQTYFHFAFKAADPTTSLYPDADSLGMQGQKANQIVQLKTDPATGKQLSDALDNGADKLLLAFSPSGVADPSPWALQGIALADIKAAWLVDVAKGTTTPLTIGPEPQAGGGGEPDVNPFAGP